MADNIQNQQLMSLNVSPSHLKLRRTPSRWLQICGLAVHLYTASGAVLAFLIVLAAIRGNAVQALWLAFIALIIDGTDGWLARRLRVSETLPWFDGRRLDDIVDYLTYVFAPVLLLWNTGHLPSDLGGMFLAVLPLLASGYQFCRTDAKTSDHFFLGFPSYWNVVAFYLYLLHPPVWVSVAMIITFAVLTFVPTPYLYATRGGPFAKLINIGAAIWFALIGPVLFGPEDHRRTVAIVSLAYPVMYLALSAFVTLTREP